MRNHAPLWLLCLALGCTDTLQPGEDAGVDAGVDPGPPGPLDAGPGVAPVISNLALSPNRAALGAGNGTVAGTLTFDYFDPDADVAVVRLTTASLTQDFPIPFAAGTTTGTLPKSISLSTIAVGQTSYQVAVFDLQGHRSNILGVVFQVDEPRPTLTALDPATVIAGGLAFTLDVFGQAFAADAGVLWNANPRTTTFVSSTHLQAAIDAEDIATATTALVTVFNPGLTGVVSAPLYFTAGALSTRVVNEPANDVVWAPQHARLYASVPAAGGSNGNSILIVDPVTANVEQVVPVGSEPGRLAVSDDGQFLYVALDGASQVKRLRLPDLSVDLTIPLGNDPALGPYLAIDLQVAPGNPRTVAVSLGVPTSSPMAVGGVAIYDDAVPRAARAAGATNLFDSIQWSPDGGTLYAANGETNDFDFYALAVSPAGVAVSSRALNLFTGYDNTLHLDPGGRVLYSSCGRVVDALQRTPLGTFGVSGPMVPLPALNTAYFFLPVSGQTRFFSIARYHLLRMTPLAAVSMPLAVGFDRAAPRLVAWGAQGLAACGRGQPLSIYSGPYLGYAAP